MRQLQCPIIFAIAIYWLAMVLRAPAQEKDADLFPEKPPLLVQERCLLTGGTCVYCLAISPDGTLIVAGQNDKSVLLWDVSQEKLKFVMSAHINVPQFAMFTKDGTKAITFAVQGGFGKPESHAILWNLATGKAEHESLMPGVMMAVARDRVVVANRGADGKSFEVVNLETMEKTRIAIPDAKDKCYLAALSPDGKILAATEHRGLFRVWDATTGKKLQQMELPYDFAHLFFSADGRTLAVMQPARTFFWEAPDWKKKSPASLNFTGSLFTPDGKYLISRGLELCSVKTNRTVAQFVHTDPTWQVKSLAISPDGTYIAAGGTPKGQIRIWDIPKNLKE